MSQPTLFCALGSETASLEDDEIRKQIEKFLEEVVGPKEEVLLLPPDFTRFHSQSGKITTMVTDYYGYTNNTKKDNTKQVPKIEILPTLGTHAPMTNKEIATMFGEELAKKDPSPFLVHDWRNDVETIGHVPADMVSKATHGMVHEPWPAQLNKLVWEKRKNKGKSLVLSIGQVVPHEVMGPYFYLVYMFHFLLKLFYLTKYIYCIVLILQEWPISIRICLLERVDWKLSICRISLGQYTEWKT